MDKKKLEQLKKKRDKINDEYLKIDAVNEKQLNEVKEKLYELRKLDQQILKIEKPKMYDSLKQIQKEKRERLKKLEKKNITSFKEGICPRCGKKNNVGTKSIGLDCIEFDWIEDLEEHIDKKIFDKLNEKYFIGEYPFEVSLCMDCYNKLIEWFGIPELVALYDRDETIPIPERKELKEPPAELYQ